MTKCPLTRGVRLREMSVSLGLTVLQIKHNVVKNPNWSNL